MSHNTCLYATSSTILQPERVANSSRVIITWSEVMPDASGRDLADIATELGCSDFEAVQRLIPGGAVYFQMSEDDVQRILAYPGTMIGSDGIVQDKYSPSPCMGDVPACSGPLRPRHWPVSTRGRGSQNVIFDGG